MLKSRKESAALSFLFQSFKKLHSPSGPKRLSLIPFRQPKSTNIVTVQPPIPTIFHSPITTFRAQASSSPTEPQSQVGAEKKCWKCGSELSKDKAKGPSLFLCPSCGVPQRLGVRERAELTYFEILDHPQTYQVESERLAASTKRLQRRLHPDLFSRQEQEVQDLSQDLSSLVNKALTTLTNPIERGRYLLLLHGVDDPIGDIEKEITNDPEFLEEVMELNERLEELSSEQDWREFRDENERTLSQLQSELGEAFENRRIEDAKALLARMKFFDSLQGKLKELKSKLGIVE